MFSFYNGHKHYIKMLKMNHYVNDSFASISFNYHTYYKKVDSQCTKVTYLYITVDSLLWWWGHYFHRYLWVMVFHEQFSFLKHLISKFVKPRNLVLYPQKVSRKKNKRIHSFNVCSPMQRILNDENKFQPSSDRHVSSI